ncbi:MAG: 3-deoxy-manno-octulosonate cytidylyltransferase [Hyphomicrobiales bacterium]|nr:MAG: 3-deoxy-manno-octulosonate cytidylyltransferase [Hyphomicrobiales bacterium]
MRQNKTDDILILIPARMGSSRFPGKPLAPLAGEPMILHVWRRAVAADLGRVAVATDSDEIAAVIRAAGGTVVMTRADHESGSDRIFEACQALDPENRARIVINLQGDLPTIAPEALRAVLQPLEDEHCDIGTLASIITDPGEITDSNVVKVVAALGGPGSVANALYFTRSPAPYGQGPYYHHIGIYAYRRAALKRFVELPPSMLERREKLEQLRALEAGMSIGAACIDSFPLGVDTPADLIRAERLLEQTS